MKTFFRYILVPFFFMLSSQMFAQVLWLEPDLLELGLKDRVSNAQYEIGSQSDALNFHPVASFSKQSELLLDVPSLDQCQIFTVFKSSLGTKESLIWKLEKDFEDQLLFTDHRMFDFTKSKFMNFMNHAPDRAQVYCYQHYRSDFQTDQLRIGALPNNLTIPVNFFEGQLAELIIFQRVLAPITRKAIESYLALKYSVPLEFGEDYLSLDGSAIWEYKKNKDFPYRTAGLGRDDELQLYQKQSKSILEGGSLSIGLGEFQKLNQNNLNNIERNQYLLWSDDGNSLDFKNSTTFPKKLDRNWKLNALSFDDNQIFFQLDHEAIKRGLEVDEQIWLLVSTGSSKEFQFDASEIHKMSLDNGVFYVEGVQVHPEIYHFSFIKAPEFWAALELEKVSCKEDEAGVVKIKAIGGNAPYHVKLLSKNSVVFEDSYYDEDQIIIDELNNERFDLEIIDGEGSFYEASFHVNSEDIDLSHIELPANVTTKEIQDYFQSFERDIDIEYHWVLPNGEPSLGLDVGFEVSGVYLLELIKDDCAAWKTFEVTAPKNNIVDMFINPNPSSTGYFNLSAELKRTAAYEIDISTLDGKKIFFQEFTEQKYIDYHGQLSNPGVYNIRLRSNGSQLSKKLIIVN